MKANLTADQQRSLDATLGAIQRIAMKIVTLPSNQREAQYEIVRKNFEESIKKFGIKGDAATLWLQTTMLSLRALVSEIEVGGGAKGGIA
jgi:hypothetical protein